MAIGISFLSDDGNRSRTSDAVIYQKQERFSILISRLRAPSFRQSGLRGSSGVRVV